MNYEYALNQCTNYLLDLLDVPPAPLPERAEGHWDDLIRLASDQHIYHYLAAWMLEYWNDALSDTVKHQLWIDLEWNKARNIKLAREIVELGAIFNKAGIPAMFLKGAAGLLRGIYPPGWRFISDIDVMIRKNDTDHACRLLKAAGFSNDTGKALFKHHHHLAPFCKDDKIGWIEIHLQPYQQDKSNTVQFWTDADTVQYSDMGFCVPSIDDHVWIAVRTDFLDGVCIPSFKETIELLLILNNGYDIRFSSLYSRAEAFNTPNIAKGLLHSLKKYTGVTYSPGFNGKPDPLIDNWESWSKEYRKSEFQDSELYGTEKDFAALRYLTEDSLQYKVSLALWFLGHYKKKYGVAVLKASRLYSRYSTIKKVLKMK